MTPLDDLLLRWRDYTLSRKEQQQLNNSLRTPEGRMQLRQEFAFDAQMLEALQLEKERALALAEVPALEVQKDAEQSGDEPHSDSVFRSTAHSLAEAGKRLIFAAAACALLLGLGFLLLPRKQIIATLSTRSDGVLLIRDGAPTTSNEETEILSGDQIQTADGSSVTLNYLKESTQIELRSATKLRVSQEATGKHLFLSEGSITARVAPQPKARPLIVTTRDAETKVIGTEFTLEAAEEATKLEVLEGTVQFSSMEDGKTILVNGGFAATASHGLELVARSLLPGNWLSQDIGDVGVPGTARVEGNRCTAKGAGHNTCRTKDQFHFVYRHLDGDGEIIAKVVDLDSQRQNARAGVVLRENLKTSAPHAFLYYRSNSGLEFERRPRFESRVDHLNADPKPGWVRLVRKGDLITAYESSDGTHWRRVGAETIKMNRRIYAGLGVTSWDNNTLATSTFESVKVIGNSP